MLALFVAVAVVGAAGKLRTFELEFQGRVSLPPPSHLPPAFASSARLREELFPAVDVSDSAFGLDRDTELAADSPLRQAQRQRTGERVKPVESSVLQTEAATHGIPSPLCKQLYERGGGY